MYKHQTTVRLRDTDAAGVVYFASQLALAHEAFESYLDSVGIGIGVALRSTHYAMPVVRVDANYKKPLRAGDVIEVELSVEQTGNTSFTLHYRILDKEEDEAGSATITHVVIDRQHSTPRPLPDPLLSALKQI